MARIRKNFASGTLTSALTSTATTMTSAELAAYPAVTAPDIASISLDPNSDFGTPEVVYITAHAAGSTTATIVRAQEGSTARSHSLTEVWINALTTTDFDAFLKADGSTTTGNAVILAGSASQVPLSLIGAVGQSANVLEIESSVGVVTARATAAGAIYGSALYDTGNRVYSASNPVPDPGTYVHLTGTETVAGLKSFSSLLTASADLSVRPGTATATITLADGTLTKTSGSGFTFNSGVIANGFTLSGLGTIALTSAASVGLIVRGAASQTGNLTEWQNSTPTVLSYVNSSGQIFDNGNRVYSGSNTNLDTTAATTISYGATAGPGTATIYARRDHIHGMPATPVTSAVAGTGISVSGATGAVTISNTGYHSGNANLASTVAAETSYGLASAVGTGTTYARNDHTHGTPATPVTSAVAGTGISVSGSTGAVTITNTGVTSIVAGTGVTISGATGAVTINASTTGSSTPATTVTSGTSFGLSAAVGTATGTFAREDHSHGTPPTPVTSIVAGSGISINQATGAVTITSTGGVSPASTVASSTAFGQAAVVGTGTAYARNDHVHGTPATPVTSAVAGTGISVSGATGAVTFTNTGATSVAGRTGAVALTAADIAAGSFPAGAFTFTSNAVGTIPLTVKGFAGQTGNLQEWRDSSNAILARVANNGTIWVGATQLGGGGAGNAADTEIMSIMGGF